MKDLPRRVRLGSGWDGKSRGCDDASNADQFGLINHGEEDEGWMSKHGKSNRGGMQALSGEEVEGGYGRRGQGTDLAMSEALHRTTSGMGSSGRG